MDHAASVWQTAGSSPRKVEARSPSRKGRVPLSRCDRSHKDAPFFMSLWRFQSAHGNVVNKGRCTPEHRSFLFGWGCVTLFTALPAHLQGFHLNSALPPQETFDISPTALFHFLQESWSNKVILSCRVHEITICALLQKSHYFPYISTSLLSLFLILSGVLLFDLLYQSFTWDHLTKVWGVEW